MNSFYTMFMSFPNYDPRSQLQEIESMLVELMRRADELDSEIPTDEALRGEHHGDMIYRSVYRDAAISMAAVGALAPFMEGMFVHLFAHLRTVKSNPPADGVHHRWRVAQDNAWDPHSYFDPQKGTEQRDVVKGTMQLIEALGLSGRFPQDLRNVMKALFEYRNKMLHNGTEWPVDERRKFQGNIDQNGRRDWFCAATIGNEPWCFYMTPLFIKQCISTAKEILAAFSVVLDEAAGEQREGSANHT